MNRLEINSSPSVDRQLSVSHQAGAKYFRTLDALAASVSLIGLADAIYLTTQHFAGQNVRCTVVTGCNEVLTSPFASIGGIPLAALGAFAYFSVFSLAILSFFGYAQTRKLFVALVTLMFVITLWLIYVQAFVLHKFCSFCLLSAFVTFALAGIVIAGKLKR